VGGGGGGGAQYVLTAIKMNILNENIWYYMLKILELLS